MPALLEEGEWHEVRRHGGRLRRPPAMLEPEGNGANSASGCRGVHEMAASTSGTSGSRSKRERGNDVHKAQGTAKRQVPVKGRGAAKTMTETSKRPATRGKAYVANANARDEQYRERLEGGKADFASEAQKKRASGSLIQESLPKPPRRSVLLERPGCTT